MDEYKHVGKRLPRIDGMQHALAKTRYVNDIRLPGMLHVKVWRSPVPSARILNVDISKAQALPGVVKIVTWKDVPYNRYGFAKDFPVLAEDEVRYMGQEVVAVAAENVDTAMEAVSLIKVDLDEREPVLDPIKAMEPNSIEVSPEGNFVYFGDKPVRQIRKGDVDGLLGAWLLNGMANALPATLVLLYVEHVLGLAAWTGLFLAAYFLAGVAALPLWLALALAVGKHRAWALSMAWACLVFAAVPLLGPGDLVPFLAVCLVSGASLGADNALPAAIQADVIDHDTAAGGGGRAGLYFGLWGMATKRALALALGVAFPLLALAGFDPAAGAGDPRALTWLYAALPIALKLCAVPLAWRFPAQTQPRNLPATRATIASKDVRASASTWR